MRDVIEHYQQDEQTLEAKYADPLSPTCIDRLARFDANSMKKLEAIDFNALDQEGKEDYLLLKNHIVRNNHARTLAAEQWAMVSALLPFAQSVFSLEDAKRAVDRPDGQKTAATLTEMTTAIASHRKELEALAKEDPKRPARIAAWRAADDADQLRNHLKTWFTFYDGYDPEFTWWCAEPYKKLDEALKQYSAFLREKMAGIADDDKTTIVGTPIGRAALIADLQDEMIPYTPEELIAMAREQLEWCRKQMIVASKEMGYGDDWHKALEAVKNTYVKPGDQPRLIYDLAMQGEEFAEKNNFVTIPDLAKEAWRMDMMTPEQQLVNPFFTGGDTISVSYPTNTMTYDERIMSMRGNNPAFSHATVFHELIPGHWLQQYMNARYRPYRQLFYDGFWIEGNAFYWEMVYWDHGFDATPQQRIGALFWRIHRCARIIFSLSFHLGKMTPEQAIDLLVNEVGHERDNAAAEVRRSFNGTYDPLYQCAYMLGALQFRALHHELVDSGKMTDRQYHDAILHEGTMPVAMLRAILTNEKLTPDFKSDWRFLDEMQLARTQF
ncbi:MAG: DUF885 family protein [Acidobacteriota bacterium]|nr:DUF885 family protein [Acidobacteriota bacterium]